MPTYRVEIMLFHGSKKTVIRIQKDKQWRDKSEKRIQYQKW